MKYDAFISYSHAKDRLLARSLQRVIQTLGKPWYRVRTARVFRDETSLTATPELWPTIVEALENSQFLLLIASREAAKSRWVSQEVEWWLANKSTKTLLIILSEGNLRWDISRGDFATSSDALPPILFDCFQNEPLWVDLSSWRSANQDVSGDVHFRGLASKIAARLKNIPPEDLWSQELAQQRRNLRTAGFAVAILLVLFAFSIHQTFLAMQNQTVAQLSTMGAAVQLGNYPLAFTNATALKRPYLLTEAQISKGETQLYEALWSNRQTKIIQLKNNEALLFEKGTENPIIRTRPGESLPPDEHVPQEGELLPRHWQKPQAFGMWSKDRRQIQITLPSTNDQGTSSNVSFSLKDCLKDGDDQYLIEKEANSDNRNYLSAKELLSDTSKGIAARDNLRAPIYYAKNDYGQEFILVEIASLATLENSEYQEVLCVVSINPEEASVINKYFPNLTLSPSSRIDRNYGLRRISPDARYYVEMANGRALTIRNVPYLSENEEIILDDLSILPYSNNIDERIAFSKDGNSYVISGYHRPGSWEQPYFVRYEDQEQRKIVLKGHSDKVETVLISDSGRTVITIDSKLTARVWDLSNNPMGKWLQQSKSTVIPVWIPNFEEDAENKKNKELLTHLDSVDGLKIAYSAEPHSATEPQCGRTIVKFGGNPSSSIIGLRDAQEYIGLVDLNKKRLVYGMPQTYHPGKLFYFCSPEDAAAFTVDVASVLTSAKEQAETVTEERP
jgi:WD40 repeat protein